MTRQEVTGNYIINMERERVRRGYTQPQYLAWIIFYKICIITEIIFLLLLAGIMILSLMQEWRLFYENNR